MALSSKQPRWDIYETVILLEGYLETLQGIQSKSQIITEAFRLQRPRAATFILRQSYGRYEMKKELFLSALKRVKS